MTGRWPLGAILLTISAATSGAAAAVPPAAPAAAPADALAQSATWAPPAADAVRDALRTWLVERQADTAQRERFEAIWAAPAGELLDRVAASLALGDEEARTVIEACSRPAPGGQAPVLAILRDEARPPIVRHNLRLLVGRWLVHEQLPDEAHECLSGLAPEDVADPVALLFYQAVAEQRLLNKEPALETIARLLERERQLPRRYASLARLMQADLAKLDEDSLDHIARRMDDIRRRLDLGKANTKTRSVQDGVIASLDKLIEEMQRQQQQQNQQAGIGRGQGQPTPAQPAPDSAPLAGRGPGEVTKKNIGQQSGWGNLPPKQRDEVLQQIGQEFPAHYRDIIEQYFRELAGGEDAGKGP